MVPHQSWNLGCVFSRHKYMLLHSCYTSIKIRWLTWIYYCSQLKFLLQSASLFSNFMGNWASSEVILWSLLSVQMIFWWNCGGESGLPVRFLRHLSSSLWASSEAVSYPVCSAFFSLPLFLSLHWTFPDLDAFESYRPVTL